MDKDRGINTVDNNCDKRITDLVNRNIMEKTKQAFPEEIKLLLKSTNFMRRVTKVAGVAIPYFDKQPTLRAVMDLFCRNRELVHFSTVCLLNGGYAETKILSRAATENYLLIRLFNLRPEIAEHWFSNPEAFRKEWRPEVIRKTVFDKSPNKIEGYTKYYGVLCDYSHPSFKGWIEQMKRINNCVSIGCAPEFNADYASECIGLMCFTIIQSVKGFRIAFEQWYTQELRSEEDILAKKLLEMVYRHFEVRFYDKKKMIS